MQHDYNMNRTMIITLNQKYYNKTSLSQSSIQIKKQTRVKWPQLSVPYRNKSVSSKSCVNIELGQTTGLYSKFTLAEQKSQDLTLESLPPTTVAMGKA